MSDDPRLRSAEIDSRTTGFPRTGAGSPRGGWVRAERAVMDRAAPALLFLRVSLGALMLVWGMDKLANPAHGIRVAERFYFGLLSSADAMPILGVLQIGLAVLVILGALRRIAYPVLALVTGMTLLGVWRSIIDPWGWMLDGTNALFFPSLTVFAAALALIALRDADVLAVDTYRRGRGVDHAAS